MGQKLSTNGQRDLFRRQLLEAQLAAYLKIVMRKHGAPQDVVETNVSKMSDEDLAFAVSIYCDLAHLPPE